MSKFFEVSLVVSKRKAIVNVDKIAAIEKESFGAKIHCINGDDDFLNVSESYEDIKYTIEILTSNHIQPVQKPGDSSYEKGDMYVS